MSVRVIEQRYCDVCEEDYSERPDWMILSAPNAPEDVQGDAQWDFCSYNCLVTWINNEEDEDAVAAVQEAEQEIQLNPDFFKGSNGPVQAVPAPAIIPQDIQPVRPAMSLADAIATGAIDFGRRR